MKHIVRKLLIQEGINVDRMKQWADRMKAKGCDPQQVQFVVKHFYRYQSILQNRDLLSYSTPEKFEALYNRINKSVDEDPANKYSQFMREFYNTEFDVTYEVHKVHDIPDDKKGVFLFGDEMHEPLQKYINKKHKPELGIVYTRKGFGGQLKKKVTSKDCTSLMIEFEVLFPMLDLGLDGYRAYIGNTMRLSNTISDLASKYGFEMITRPSVTDGKHEDRMMGANETLINNIYAVTPKGVAFGNEQLLWCTQKYD